MRTLDAFIWETATQTQQFADVELLLICNDPTGALTEQAIEHARNTGIHVAMLDADYSRCQRAGALGAEVAGEQRLDNYLGENTNPASTVVALGEMPKSLHRLDYIAKSIAGAGYEHAEIVLGANNKHLTRTMNKTLESSFRKVAATRGRGKFRCITAAQPRADITYEPHTANGFVAIGGVFAGAKIDRGGALLRQNLPIQLGRFLDLGCGNGAVSRGLDGDITATDADADAVLSARAIGLHATWDDAGSKLPAAHYDTIALNPPFHDGTTVDSTLVQHLLDAAQRLLAPGGSLYLVHNSHLRYRQEVQRRFHTVEQIARDNTFTVLRARR